ncbi:MAG: imidazole glycerol phosphate synthase subunit HisH [Deltaproteobacteria bacterium]|nr:imidazole glycerol phosphate synthase subunit HisH [Deltaproteobacteria bacterium]
MSAEIEVAVVDYGAGNLRSVSKALERSGLGAKIVTEPEEVRAADAIVLPGVGAFPDAVASLQKNGLDQALCEQIRSGTPYLGLCLGLQLLFEESDEHGNAKGFGIFEGRVERFPKTNPDGSPLCVPHIGWNEVVFEGTHPMVSRLPASDYLYFVHSYYAVPKEESIIAGRTDYAGPFTAAVAKDNVFAVQCHPEKSQWAGKRLLDAFAAWLASGA